MLESGTLGRFEGQHAVDQSLKLRAIIALRLVTRVNFPKAVVISMEEPVVIVSRTGCFERRSFGEELMWDLFVSFRFFSSSVTKQNSLTTGNLRF